MKLSPLSFSKFLQTTGEYFREGVERIAILKENPQIVVDFTTILGAFLAQLIDTHPPLSGHFLKLLTVCEYANILCFFSNLNSTKIYFKPFYVDRINLAKLIEEICLKSENNAIALASLKHASQKLQSMNRFGDNFKEGKEFLKYLNKPEGENVSVNQIIDFTKLEVELKPLTELEKIKGRSWLCGSIASLADVLQGLDLLEVGGFAANIGSYTPFLGFVLAPGIEAWTNIFNIAGYLFQALDAHSKIGDLQLTFEEREEACRLRNWSLAEVALSAGTVLTIAWLGPISYLSYPSLITARRLSLCLAKGLDLHRRAKKIEMIFLGNAISSLENQMKNLPILKNPLVLPKLDASEAL